MRFEASCDEIDKGYFELRVNWDAQALMAMSGAQLDRLKGLIDALEGLSQELSQPSVR